MSDQEIVAVESEIVAQPTRAQLAPIVQAVANGALSVEQLDRLLDAQERWQASEAKKAYAEAMAAVKEDPRFKAVLNRDQRVAYDRVHYTHTSLAAAVGATATILGDHGFSLSWVPTTTDKNVRVTCRLTHREGHSEEAALEAPPDTKGSKSVAQGIASTVTLLQRYTMLSLLGMATADMKEPPPPRTDEPDAVDLERNNRAATAIRKAGKSIEDAAKLCAGRGMDAWTAADLAAIKEWIKSAREPGQEG